LLQAKQLRTQTPIIAQKRQATQATQNTEQRQQSKEVETQPLPTKRSISKTVSTIRSRSAPRASHITQTNNQRPTSRRLIRQIEEKTNCTTEGASAVISRDRLTRIVSMSSVSTA